MKCSGLLKNKTKLWRRISSLDKSNSKLLNSVGFLYEKTANNKKKKRNIFHDLQNSRVILKGWRLKQHHVLLAAGRFLPNTHIISYAALYSDVATRRYPSGLMPDSASPHCIQTFKYKPQTNTKHPPLPACHTHLQNPTPNKICSYLQNNVNFGKFVLFLEI